MRKLRQLILRSNIYLTYSARSWLRSCLPSSFGAEKPPRPERIVHETEVNGRVLRDEFSWIQDKHDAKTKKYIAAENRYTSKMLISSSLEKITQEMIFMDLFKIQDQFLPELPTQYEVFDDYMYYETHKLKYEEFCRRKIFPDGSNGPEEMILDINELLKEYTQCSVHALKPSKSQKFIAYVLDVDGTDMFIGHILSMEDGRGQRLDVLENIFNLEWSGDDGTILYTTQNEQNQPHEVWSHVVGSDQSSDILLYREKDPRFFLDITSTKDKEYVTINSNSKSTSEVHVIPANQPGELTLLSPRQTGSQYFVEHSKGQFYILSQVEGQDYQVFKTSTSHPNKEHWKPLIPERPKVVIHDMEVFQDYCVLHETVDLLPQLTIVPLDASQDMYTVKFQKSVCKLEAGSNKTFSSQIFEFSVSSPIMPPASMTFDMRTKKQDSPFLPKRHKDYLCERLSATSQDGVKVPMTVFRNRLHDTKTNPMMVLVYGGYGVNLDLQFCSSWVWLLDHGWSIAFCHVRGGGEMGRQWYHEGRHLNKLNSMKDLSCCIKSLHEAGFSSPQLTVLKGSSAGGMVAGSFLNTSSHLISAAILKVPSLDTVTTMLDESLPLTLAEKEELGDLRDSKTLDYVLSYCPYANLTEMRHVSVLVTAGMLDTRTPFWSPIKWVAKLRALRGQPRHRDGLVLLQVGHVGHFGSSEQSGFEVFAEEMVFLYKELGLDLRSC